MIEHVIKEGENLDIIAKKYKTTVKNIVEDNKIKDRTRLGIGNRLKINESKKENKNDVE